MYVKLLSVYNVATFILQITVFQSKGCYAEFPEDAELTGSEDFMEDDFLTNPSDFHSNLFDYGKQSEADAGFGSNLRSQNSDSQESYAPKRQRVDGKGSNNYDEFYDYFEDLAKEKNTKGPQLSRDRKRSVYGDFHDFMEEKSNVKMMQEQAFGLDTKAGLKRRFVYETEDDDLSEDFGDYAEIKNSAKRKRFTKHANVDAVAPEKEVYATLKPSTGNEIVSRERAKKGKSDKGKAQQDAQVKSEQKHKDVLQPKLKSSNSSEAPAVELKTEAARQHTLRNGQSFLSSKESKSKKQDKTCHPPAGPPKFTWFSEGSEDAKGKEYEDMLKGKVAERTVKVIHAKVCKSPKLSKYFGHCKGKESEGGEECDSLFKPEVVKEIMGQLEAINTSETCHQLPPKLHEFLKWLIKVKKVRYVSMRKSQPVCQQYSNCTRGDSAFLFHRYESSIPFYTKDDLAEDGAGGWKEDADDRFLNRIQRSDLQGASKDLDRLSNELDFSYSWAPNEEDSAIGRRSVADPSLSKDDFSEDLVVESKQDADGNISSADLGFDPPIVIDVPEYDYTIN